MAEASTSGTASTSTAESAPKIRHEWYQTDAEVNVSVFVKNVKADDLKVELHPRSAAVTIKLPTGSELVFDLDPLSHEIDPSRSSFRPLSTKVELKLAKSKSHVKWANLEGEEGDSATMATADTARKGFAYPTSSRHKTNWDALAKQQADEDNKTADTKSDPNSGGDRELNKLFQKLYADATDEQRKAMVKSYQESNGTSLSTNWDDVKKKKVETMPPESMVAKPWKQ